MVTTFLLGVLIAILFEELTDIRPGGIIIPGFLALSLDDPIRIVLTLALSALTVGITTLAGRFILLYKQRRFAFNILTGAGLKAVLIAALPALFVLSPALLVVGYVIPGVIAESCQRQGIIKTLLATGAASGITGLLAFGLGVM